MNLVESAVKMSFLDLISLRRRKFLAWTTAGFLVYTVCGFLVLPPIVRLVAVNQLSKILDRPVAIQSVRLNPYMLSATVRGLAVRDKDNATLVSWDEAYANFQLISLFSHAWVFKEVSLSQPFVRVQVNKDSRLTFSDIEDRFSPPNASKVGETSKPRAWRINRLRLSGAKVSFIDLTPRMPFRKTLGPLNITASNFQTDFGHNSSFRLSGISDGGEKFSWNASLCLDPFLSEGEVSVDGLALRTYAPLYQDLVRFDIEGGVISLHSSYRFERSPAAHLLAVTGLTFALRALEVVEKESGQTVATISNFVITGASADGMARQAEAQSVTLDGGRFLLRRNQDTSINAIELSKPAAKAPSVPGGIVLLLRAMTNVVAMLLSSTNISNGEIRELNVTNSALLLEDLANSQPVRLDLEGIAIDARNLSNRAGTNMTAEARLRWDTNGSVRMSIKAGLSPPSADVKLAFDNLNLLPLAPYLVPHLNVLVLGGKLGLTGDVRLRSSNHGLPEVRFRGDARLDGFSTAEGLATEGLLQWSSLRLSGVEANLNPPVVSVTNARFSDVFARLIIETNRTLNLMSVVRRGGTNQAAALRPTNAVAPMRPKLSLGSVVLSNASVHFIDRSIQPNVNITLEQLSGTLSGLSSDDPRPAVLQLQGTVDKTARAEIGGQINPWNSTRPVDLTLSLKDMELLPEDPYAGKYLGYRLLKGKLNAQLSYQITERTLKSQNLVTLDQLTLGQKVESPEATRLPVRLAIALLKDRAGKIALDLPVNGSLDDPQFSLGKVAYRAIETVLTRIVTSPFSVLGALFGGKGEELSFQEFQPGSTNLLPAAMAKLDALAKGLYERPDLQVEIQGSADSQTDLEALRREKLKQQSSTQAWDERLSTAAPKVSGAEGLAVQSSKRALAPEKGATALMRPVAYSTPIELTSSTTNSLHLHGPRRVFADDKGATALMMVLAPAQFAGGSDWDAQLLEAVEIAADALPTLAKERARNVKAYLVQTGKIEAARITESAPSTNAKGSRVYLRLQ